MSAPKRSAKGSPFTVKECQDWQRRLIAQRVKLVADSELLAAESASEPSARRDGDLHSAEVVISEQEDVSRTLRQIDAALVKLTGHGPVPFGICEVTGERIERERLDLMPWTPVSARGAKQGGG
jgi:RNA polymerase-binding transcription factor DksA